MQKSRSTSFASNLRWGLSWSIGFVVAYSLIALAVFILAGPPPYTSFANLILTYVILGILAGLTLGVLRPIGKTKAGAIILGMIIGILVYLGAGVSFVGVHGFRNPGGVIGLLIAGLVVGGLMGRKSWISAQQQNDRGL